MSFYNTFQTDENLENGQGVDLDYGQNGIITIHRAGGSNKSFARVLNAKMKPYSRQLQTDTMEDEIASKLLIETYAETVIINWKNVTDQEGNKLAFNRSNCIKILTDLPELFKDIQNQANSISNFRKEQEEIEAKNLQKS